VGHSIILSVNVDATRERVFGILTSTEGQKSFWTEDCEVHGDHARFGFAEAPVDLVVSVHQEPNALVQMKVVSGFPFWDGSTWEWELSENGEAPGGTTVIFRHYGFGAGIDENSLGGTAQTWAMTLECLTKFIATGIAQPYFVARDPD
jgi:uncharacterized protein YndB with AHSA1/START domain